jgi:threonine/homoserine/homoserine lactone efflux protein
VTLGIHDYLLFVATGVFLNLIPGQDTLYIVGSSIAYGRRVGIASALGIGAGCVVHTLAAAVGLSAVLATSATAFMVIKLAGAAYLIYLGIRAFVAPAAALSPLEHSASTPTGLAFRRGVLTNVLNPKVALFFLALLPQFIDSDSPRKVVAFLALGLTFVATGTAWCLFLAVSASRIRGYFVEHPRALSHISRACGLLFIFLGLRLAASER